ncbi:putative serine/threonine-protein kinase-like protein CCR3 [Capsicum chinense]|nr:putative serine/threonine-protein kinase-like protein CCR3 [Capsicum chinense]
MLKNNFQHHTKKDMPTKAIISSSRPVSTSSTLRHQGSRLMRHQRSGTSSKHTKKAEEFQFTDLAAATNNFLLENQIGSCSFGIFYKGKLLDSSEVAIKHGETCPRMKKFQEKESAFDSELIVHLSLVSTNQELKMPFFLTLRSVQTLLDAKVIDRIKMELVGATTITRKIILESGFVVVDGLSGDEVVGGGSGAAVGANDAPLIVFKANYYEAKHDVMINAINALTASVKKLTSKRGLIPSRRILFPSASLEIRSKRRRRMISRALSSI